MYAANFPPEYWAAATNRALATLGASTLVMSPPPQARYSANHTPGDDVFDEMLRGAGGGGTLLSAKKSIFDSPPPKSQRMDDLMMSCGGFGDDRSRLDIRGMTPMSDLRDTFLTPSATVESECLSQEDAERLNKTLFSEAVVATPHVSGSCDEPAEAIHFQIGGDVEENKYTEDMRLGNRVSISPIDDDAGKAPFFEDDAELENSIPVPPKGDEEDMPPPTAPRVRKMPALSMSTTRKIMEATDFTKTPHLTPGGRGIDTSFLDSDDDSDHHKFGNATPFDSCKMVKELTKTPSTVAMTDNSFWSEHGVSPVPLSPFRSPTFTDPASTSKKRQRSENDVCQPDNLAKARVEQEQQ